MTHTHAQRTITLSWRTIAGALPAVALIGSGVGLTLTGGNPATEIVADSSPLVTVPDTALRHLEAPSLPPLPELPAPAEQAPTAILQPTGLLPSALTVSGIPAAALAAYQRAATIVGAADPQCHVDWALVAAIGKVESNHGRYGGNGIDHDGTVRPGIYGIPLNGSNDTATIRDTDGGTYDRDATWDRAVGPMQFIPGTWRSVGVDANGDGRKDPQNISDAATATAVYLCSGPGDLSTDSGARSAVLRYNHSDAYADQVLSIAQGYRAGYTVVPESDLTDSQRTGSPFLPSGEPQTMRDHDATTASKPAAGPAARPKPGASSGGSGSGSTSGGGSTPAPSTTATSNPVGDAVGGVTDTVGTVVGGLTGSSPTPTPSTPASTTSAPLPLEVLPVSGRCPTGYDPVLSALEITVLCTLHQ
jgi:hypothetical protein